MVFRKRCILIIMHFNFKHSKFDASENDVLEVSANTVGFVYEQRNDRKECQK